MSKIVDILLDILISIEFWINLIVSKILNELRNLETMSITKSMIVGVGTIMWNLKEKDL